jgi:hypothetical protein
MIPEGCRSAALRRSSCSITWRISSASAGSSSCSWRAARPSSPDYHYYQAVRERLGGKRPALSVARKPFDYFAFNAWLAELPGYLAQIRPLLGEGRLGDIVQFALRVFAQ